MKVAHWAVRKVADLVVPMAVQLVVPSGSVPTDIHIDSVRRILSSRRLIHNIPLLAMSCDGIPYLR